MNNCLQGQIECILFPPFSAPLLCVPFQERGFTIPPAPLPTPRKQHMRNRDQSWELWTASLWHYFGSSKYHRSLRFHASLPSQYKILPATLCPEMFTPKRTIASQRNTFPAVYCVHRCWERVTVPSVADAINTNPSRRRPCCFLLSSASWSSAKVPDEPKHVQFQSFYSNRARVPLGNQAWHTAGLCDCSCWCLLSSAAPLPSTHTHSHCPYQFCFWESGAA